MSLKKDSIKIQKEVINLMYHMPNLTWEEAWIYRIMSVNLIVSTIK